MSSTNRFTAAMGLPTAERLRRIENWLSRYGLDLSGQADDVTASEVAEATLTRILESQVIFDPSDGHNHDGENSTPIDHAQLTNVLPDQHHDQVHNLFGTDHGDVDTAVSPTNGQVLVWSDATSLWVPQTLSLAHTLLEHTDVNPSAAPAPGDALIWDGTHWTPNPALTQHALLGSSHNDVSATGTTRGALLYRNGSNQWIALAPTTSAGRYLGTTLVGGVRYPSWNQIPHSELTGSGANDHHNQVHPLTGTDHTVSGQTIGDLLVATGAASFALQAPGLTFFTTGAAAPSASVAAGCLYWDSRSDQLKLYRSSGGGVWVALASLALLGLSVSGRTDGELMMATGATSYSMEALSSRVSRSGSGSPNGVLTGLTGALYLDTGTNALYRCSGGTTWVAISPAGGSGAPVGAQYITAAADATLTNELVLGSAVIMSGVLGSRPAFGTAGRLYYATDDNGGTFYRDTGSAWQQIGPATTHSLTSHSLSGATTGQLLVATGASAYTLEAPGQRIIMSGPLGSMPPAASSIAGSLYLVTDDDGGTLFRSTGAAWVKCGAGVNGGGDISGALDAAVVDGIQGKAVNGAPAVGTFDNLKGLYYSSDSGMWEYAQRAEPVVLWRRASISGIATTYSEMPGLEGYDTGFVVPYDCYIVGASITLSGDVGAAGVDYSIQIYSAPDDNSAYAATGHVATITGAVNTQRTSWVRDVATFCAAGTRITLYDKRTGAVNGVSARGTVWIALAE